MSKSLSYQAIKCIQKMTSIKEYKTVKKSRKRWTQRETRYYLNFILENKQVLEKQHKREKQYIYNKMAQQTGRKSRNCKSHHQKMIKKFNNIEGILASKTNHILDQEQSIDTTLAVKSFKLKDYDTNFQIRDQEEPCEKIQDDCFIEKLAREQSNQDQTIYDVLDI